MRYFDENKVVYTLSRLSVAGAVAFATSCASRFSDSYDFSLSIISPNETSYLKYHLEKLWNFALFEQNSDWKAMHDNLTKLIPDEEEGAGFFHGIIDDALSSTAYAVQTAMTSDPKVAVNSARRGYESVDRFAGYSIGATSFTKSTETSIIKNITVQEELERQYCDLVDLISAPADDLKGVIDTIRIRALESSLLPIEMLKHMAGRDTETARA